MQVGFAENPEAYLARVAPRLSVPEYRADKMGKQSTAQAHGHAADNGKQCGIGPVSLDRAKGHQA